MIEDLDELIDDTRKRVAKMRRLTGETARLLGETKKAEEDLAATTEHIQIRQAQKKDSALPPN
jgi:hypothetical protein